MTHRSMVATVVAAGLLLAACSTDTEDGVSPDVAATVEDGGAPTSDDDAAPAEGVDTAEDVDGDDDADATGDETDGDDELFRVERDGYRFFELGETAVVDTYDYDFEITVHDVTFVDTLPGELADEPALKDNFFIAELTLRNTGDIAVPVQRLRPDLGLTDDLAATSNPTLPLDEESAVDELAPGEELTGRYWGDTRIHDSYYFGFAGSRGGMAQWIVPGQ